MFLDVPDDVYMYILFDLCDYDTLINLSNTSTDLKKLVTMYLNEKKLNLFNECEKHFDSFSQALKKYINGPPKNKTHYLVPFQRNLSRDVDVCQHCRYVDTLNGFKYMTCMNDKNPHGVEICLDCITTYYCIFCINYINNRHGYGKETKWPCSRCIGELNFNKSEHVCITCSNKLYYHEKYKMYYCHACEMPRCRHLIDLVC